jgi:hypothetical protein
VQDDAADHYYAVDHVFLFDDCEQCQNQSSSDHELKYQVQIRKKRRSNIEDAYSASPPKLLIQI